MTNQETQTEQPGMEKTPVEETGTENAAKAANAEAAQGSAQTEAVSSSDTSAQEQNATGLEAQLAETRDQLLRKAAEFENFRKRMNQEKQNAIEYANQSLLLDIITVIDDFERAIQSGENSLQSGSADYASLLEGIKMIEKRLSNQLEAKWGLKRFNSAGEIFDPNMHEAVMMEKSPDVSEATVQEDLMKGYMLKERVIRAAKVKVLMPEA